ncbi:MAG: DUF4079 family protein [Nitrospirota bacterium]
MEKTSLLLPFLHGAYNVTVFIFLLFQARTGFVIRKGRTLGIPPGVESVRRHRKSGLALVPAGTLGFFAGLFLAWEAGHIAEHPAHFAFGLLIVLLLMLTLLVSRKIRGRDSRWRTLHAVLGILIICSYTVQIILGLDIVLAPYSAGP